MDSAIVFTCQEYSRYICSLFEVSFTRTTASENTMVGFWPVLCAQKLLMAASARQHSNSYLCDESNQKKFSFKMRFIILISLKGMINFSNIIYVCDADDTLFVYNIWKRKLKHSMTKNVTFVFLKSCLLRSSFFFIR